MGQGGYPSNHEWTLYTFDSMLMFSVMVIFCVWYPSRVRPLLVYGAETGEIVQLERHTTKHKQVRGFEDGLKRCFFSGLLVDVQEQKLALRR